MAKLKFCEVGNHTVPALWKAKTKVQKSCCKNCLYKADKPEPKPEKVPEVKPEVKQLAKELKLWFASQALVFPDACENCGSPLIVNQPFDRTKMTCHILPKKKGHGGFPSVATHPENRVFMCCDSGCYGHGRWDNGNADDRIKMPVYRIAVERFKKLEDVLTTNEHVRALKYLKLD